MKKYFFIAFIFINLQAMGQVNWNVVQGSSILLPSIIEADGSLKIKGEQVFGKVTFNLDNNEYFLFDGELTHKVEKKDVEGFSLAGFIVPDVGEMTAKTKDSLKASVRRKNYPSWSLNVIQYTVNKKKKFIIENGKIIEKGEKNYSGKLCSIDPHSILLLDSEGELTDLKQGGFSYISFAGERFFNVGNLYEYFFTHYKTEYNNIVHDWEANLKKSSIDQLFNFLGPLDNIFNLSANSKMLVWQTKALGYSFDLYSLSSSRSTALTWNPTNSSYRYRNFYQDAGLFGKVPSFFLNEPTFYTDSGQPSDYRPNHNLSYTEGNTSGMQKGEIQSYDKGYKISVLTDNNNVIQSVFHKGIFNEPTYGNPFYFIR